MAFGFFGTKKTRKTPSFGFKLPKQTPAPKKSFLLSEKETAEWIESLPMANVGETSRQIFKTLINFNRMQMPFGQRLKILELIRQPIKFVQSNLEKHYYDIGMPLAPKSHKISVLAKEINSEMAVGYKRIAEDIISSNKKTFNSRVLVIAMHRSIQYMIELIYQLSLVYETIPDGIWHDIHHIYSYAYDNGIAKVSIKSSNTKEKVNIEDLYLLVNLFTAASPSRLRAKEISFLIQSIPKWTEYYQITNSKTFGDPIGRFTIDALSDEGPVPAKISNMEEISRLWILNTRPLIRYLHQYRHAKIPQKSWMSKFPKSFLDQLIKSWSYGTKRDVERTTFHFELHLVTSLASLFDHLPEVNHNQDVDLTEKERSFFEQNSKFDFQHEHTSGLKMSPENDRDLNSPSLLDNSIFQSVPSFNDSVLQSLDEDETKEAIFICKTVNESTGGYCISWQGDGAPLVKVGEIVGIQAASDSTQFGIAVTRWIHHSHEEGLLVGIQLISSSVTAAELVDTIEDKENLTVHRALLLQPMKMIKRRESLILSPFNIEKSKIFQLISSVGRDEIKIKKIVESNGAFVQYYYEIITPIKEEKNPDSSEQDEDGDFDQLWSSL